MKRFDGFFGRRRRPVRAFNLLELIMVLALIGLLATLAFPALTRVLQRERAEGFLRTATLMVERAKGEAAKRNLPVVVRADYTRDALFAFADSDRDGQSDPGEPEIFYLALPAAGSAPDRALQFWAAGEPLPEMAGAVTGFSPDPTPGATLRQLILEADGSARDAGAFRFGLAGSPGNYYELRVDPPATARIQLRKYIWDPPAAYLSRNPGSAATWPWY